MPGAIEGSLPAALVDDVIHKVRCDARWQPQVWAKQLLGMDAQTTGFEARFAPHAVHRRRVYQWLYLQCKQTVCIHGTLTARASTLV